MTCECGHLNKVHKILHYASGRVAQKCEGLGLEHRPIAGPGSEILCNHHICRCEKNMTPKVYLVKTHDRKAKETYVNKEFSTREEAQKHMDKLDAFCDAIWCENHHNWIEPEQ